MNHLRPDVPIVGRQPQALITDVRVVVPNVVELRTNGLDMGASVAHLFIANPALGRAWLVPLTAAQVNELADAFYASSDGNSNNTQHKG